jgi:phospholipid/cholesterol/gamma-HCH transport system substrate-binding protein
LDPFVGAQARPNEVTYSEPWMRPDFVPPANPADGPPTPGALPSDSPPPGPLAAEAAAPTADADTGSAAPTNPAAGLPGMMVPGQGGGS